MSAQSRGKSGRGASPRNTGNGNGNRSRSRSKTPRRTSVAEVEVSPDEVIAQPPKPSANLLNDHDVPPTPTPLNRLPEDKHVNTRDSGEAKTPARPNESQGVQASKTQPTKTPRPKKLSELRKFGFWTVDLYIVRNFLIAYAICTISFLGLFVLIEAFAKLDRFLRQDGSVLLAIFRYGVAMVPTVYANYLGPVITLAAAMFTFTTMNRQNELTPLKASGVSIYRICVPIFLLATAAAGLTFYLQEEVIPRFKTPIRDALAVARGKPLRNLMCHDNESGYLIGVGEYSPTEMIGRDVYVLARYPDGKPKRRIDAHQMEWIRASAESKVGPPQQPLPSGKQADDMSKGGGLNDGGTESGHWTLRNASIQRWDSQGNLLLNASASRFERLKSLSRTLDLKTSIRPIDLETSDLEISYLSWKELKTQYQRQPEHRHLAVKLHHHFAFPLSHIVLLLLGIPFTLSLGNRSQFVSLAASFAICALFHIVTSISMNIANHSEFFSPVLAAWLPILLFGSLGITLFDHLPS